MQENEAIQTEEEQEATEVVELDEVEQDSESEQVAAPIEDVSVEETKADQEQDELEDYSKNVQKRIKTLTKKMREQERAALREEMSQESNASLAMDDLLGKGPGDTFKPGESFEETAMRHASPAMKAQMVREALDVE